MPPEEGIPPDEGIPPEEGIPELGLPWDDELLDDELLEDDELDDELLEDDELDDELLEDELDGDGGCGMLCCWVCCVLQPCRAPADRASAATRGMTLTLLIVQPALAVSLF